MDLTIPVDKLSFIIMKAREYDAKVPTASQSRGPVEDYEGVGDVLEDRGNDSTRHEVHHLIDDLNDDEAVELVALSWIGRGTYSPDDWVEACNTARDEKGDHSTADYLLGTPLIADYLEEGLAAFNKRVDTI